MLFCCSTNLRVLRPYSYIALIITLLFHIFEIVELGQSFGREKWTIILLLCHMMVAFSTIPAFRGVITKEDKPLITHLVLVVFGFFPIIVDIILVLANNVKIFSFDASFIEKIYGVKDTRLIVALILILLLVIKSDFTVAIYNYFHELRRTNPTSTNYTRL